jgi:glycosyltransferase involved in cell wall biosynthesis
MNKPFFSVIVPAHNSEGYLVKCLGSVAKQTFRDYELIVVCDRCQDDTEGKARLLADKVIITDFGMDGLARNAGIDEAEGEWILFLDDDDWWIHEYVLEDIHNLVTGPYGEMLDMVCFDFIWKGKGYARVLPNRMNIAVWSKAFRREFLGDTRFPAIPFTSDQPFMDEICAKKPTIVPMNELMYYYNYMREGSQTEMNARPDGVVPEAGTN